MRLATASACLALAACHAHDPEAAPRQVEREYARPAGEVWSAAVDGVKAEGVDILSARFDRPGGALEAREVHVTVTPVNEARSRVAIRVGPDGLPLARRLHERIAESLSRKGGSP